MLQSIALNLESWSIQVKREKGVYYTLNKFSVDVTRKVLVCCLISEASCPPLVRAAEDPYLCHALYAASSPAGGSA